MSRKTSAIAFLLGMSLQILAYGDRKLQGKPEDIDDNFALNKDTFNGFIDKWNSSYDEVTSSEHSQEEEETQNGIEAQISSMFQASTSDSSMVLSDITTCLTSYKFLDCAKMLVLNRVRTAVRLLESYNTTGMDFEMLNGLVTFKWDNKKLNTVPMFRKSSSLSDHLNYYVLRLFESRSLQIQLLPGVGLDLTPISKEGGDLCFSARLIKDSENRGEVEQVRKSDDQDEKDKKNKKKKGFNMMPMMIIPQMIMLGMLPFALANLKSMVMNALMVNSMALNGAIFMTIRNLVFGPRRGSKVKYVNYGYNKKIVNKKPELVFHAPAAFVTKPEKKHPHYQAPDIDHYDNPNSYHHENDYNQRQPQRKKQSQGQSFAQIPYPPYTPNNVNSLQPNNIQPSSYQPSNVDAPISYLNNNHYLMPSGHVDYSQSSSFSYELTEKTPGKKDYSAYNDVQMAKPTKTRYHPFVSKNSRVDGSNTYSKFNDYEDEEESELSDKNYYSNHRPQ